ncbi:unnamed protein product, partial [Dibothriocephalus latus]
MRYSGAPDKPRVTEGETVTSADGKMGRKKRGGVGDGIQRLFAVGSMGASVRVLFIVTGRVTRLSGVPLLLTEMVKALRVRGLSPEGIYRVADRAFKVQDIIQLANSLCVRLDLDEEAFYGRDISSAIKRYLGLLPTSLLNADAFASVVVAED